MVVYFFGRAAQKTCAKGPPGNGELPGMAWKLVVQEHARLSLLNWTVPSRSSLTEGFYARGTLFHPYSNRLAKLLRSQLPAGSTVLVAQKVRLARPPALMRPGGRPRVLLGPHATPRRPDDPWPCGPQGVSGELVTASMARRLDRTLTEAGAQGVRFDFILLLGVSWWGGMGAAGGNGRARGC